MDVVAVIDARPRHTAAFERRVARVVVADVVVVVACRGAPARRGASAAARARRREISEI